MKQTNTPVPLPDGSQPPQRSEYVSPPRLVGYGLGALAVTVACTWGLAELATPPGTALATADLGGLGRTVGLIAAAAVGVPAAVLAYHRQRALDTANHVAKSQHDHKVVTDSREHHTGVERHLRERYATCAEQLGSTNFAIRLAGVYALASLADDWHEVGNDSERQVCIELLCGYLRTERQPSGNIVVRNEKEEDLDGIGERQVRTAIIGSIRARTRTNGRWIGGKFDLSGANLTKADLSESNLANIDLSGADLSEAFLSDTDLSDADLCKANLSDATLQNTILTRAVLTEADLPGATLWDADLTDAILQKANLADAWISRTNFTRADLFNVNLTDATLDGSNFSDANLFDVNFTDADLCEVNLSGATLIGANLTGSDLSGADLTGADLTGEYMADEMSQDERHCRYSDSTKWPAGFTPPPSAVAPELSADP